LVTAVRRAVRIYAAYTGAAGDRFKPISAEFEEVAKGI